MENDERRRNRRFPVENLEGTLLYSQKVTVENMSIDGMLVESTAALRPGSVYRIKIEHEGSFLQVSARVRRCYVKRMELLPGGESQTIFESGLNFDGILSQKAPSIIDLIEKNLVIDLERRIFGRFQIRLEDPVQLSKPYEFIVSTLSLSGMKIRATVLPEIGTTYSLGIGMPNDDFIEIRGKVVFVKPVHVPVDRYVAEVGIQFLSLSAADRTALVDILNDHTGIHQLPLDPPPSESSGQ